MLAVRRGKIIVRDEILFEIIRQNDLLDQLVKAFADLPAGDGRVFHVDHRVRGCVQIMQHDLAVGSERLHEHLRQRNVGAQFLFDFHRKPHCSFPRQAIGSSPTTSSPSIRYAVSYRLQTGQMWTGRMRTLSPTWTLSWNALLFRIACSSKTFSI